MAYKFTSGAQYIDYTTQHQFYRGPTDDMSVGVWVRFVGVTFNDANAVLVAANFPPMMCNALTLPGHIGLGIRCAHMMGGSASFGVACYPGDIDAAFSWSGAFFRYFGFTRTHSDHMYRSYCGNSGRFLACQTYNYTDGGPFPEILSGQANGPFCVGLGSHGVEVGRFTYWSRALDGNEHRQLASCSFPSDRTGLLIYSTMGLGAADDADDHWPATLHGSPEFVDESPCVDATADNYRLYVA